MKPSPSPGHDSPSLGPTGPQPRAGTRPAEVPPPDRGEMPCTVDDFEARLRALLALRQQMLELHARLETLRLLLRLSARPGGRP